MAICVSRGGGNRLGNQIVTIHRERERNDVALQALSFFKSLLVLPFFCLFHYW